MMQVQLKVLKADGSIEEYLHTKVIGIISSALAGIDQADICVAEQLAEVVTYFLYQEQDRRNITSSEIFSIIKAVLTTTGYEEAAIALSEHHFERKLKRARTEVVSTDICELDDAEQLCRAEDSDERSQWNKSKIIDGLTAKHNIDRQTARAIASLVEEKIFSMGVTSVSVGLIKQLVLGDAATVLRAQRQLQAV